METDSDLRSSSRLEAGPGLKATPQNDANNSEERKVGGVGQAGGDGDGDGGGNEGEEDDDEYDSEDDAYYICKNVKRILKGLEQEAGMAEGLLQNNVRVTYCDATFEESDEVVALSRIHPLVGTKHIDVHFSYYCRSRAYSVEWYFTLGYKISRPSTPKPSLREFRDRRIDRMYGTQGWRSIAYGLFDDQGKYGRDWTRKEVFSFDMDLDGILDIHEVLWGPLADLPPDASADDQIKQRQSLIRALGVLLASVGVEYDIACKDDQCDYEPSRYGMRGGLTWMLEGTGDRWFARGARKACGFQLARDPEEERKGQQNREEEARGHNDGEDDYDSEGPYERF
ncbi:hypothetical protein BD779DRAFT_1469447 [Infundibulicybe gibba]|nr:hypothetical protein BD779DRAFT_1469447 [Infundibulicybe gibba]